MSKEKIFKRRIPMDPGFMNHKVDDILYGFLIASSTFNLNTKELYLSYSNALKAKRAFASLARVDIRTVRNHIKVMIDGGYIIQKENGDYIFSNESKEWQLIELNMLKYLVATRNDNCIKIYCYLLKKFLWKEDSNDKYKFTQGELARALQYTESSSKQGKVLAYINLILESLAREGVISYVEFREEKTPYLRLVHVVQKYEELPQLGKKNKWLSE